MNGLRHLRRNMAFNTAVILLLAVGIGANTLVFSLVNELLLKPLPVRNPENLHLLQELSDFNVRPNDGFSYRFYREVVQPSGLFSGAAAEQGLSQVSAIAFMAAGAPVRLVSTQIVSPNYFLELGVPAVLGRVLTAEDATAGKLAVVLSYQFWQSQFAGDRTVIGREIRLKGTPFTVVGVLPREFHSSDLDRAPDVRLPISAATAIYGRDVMDLRDDHALDFRLLLRLAPGTTAGRAIAELQPQFRQAEEARQREEKVPRFRPDANSRLVLPPIGAGASQLRDQFSRALLLLMGGVGLLVLAVCANVAGLLLAKSGRRRKEMAIRVSLGATRFHLVRQLMGEYLLLAIPGCILGAALADALAPYLVAMLPPPRDYGQFVSAQLLTVSPDWRVLAFTAALTVFCLLAFGLAPALRSAQVSLNSAMKSAAGQGQSRPAGLVPVAVQVVFSMVLLAAALLMLRTFRSLERLDPGFDRDHVAGFTFDPVDAGYDKTRTGAFYRALREKVAAIPGVRSVAFASRGLMRSVGFKTTLAPQGVVLPTGTFMNTSFNPVTPGYFATMGIRLLAGRDLTLKDGEGQPPAMVVVNRAFANQFFPNQDPLGKLLAQDKDGTKPPYRTIVGLVETAKYRSMREPDPPTFYSAIDESKSEYALLLYVRTHGPPQQVISAVRKAGTEVDSGVPLIEALTIEQEIQTSLWQEKLVALLAAFFGLASVLLAAIGLYGTLSSSVAQRARELGIRVAIGAHSAHIVRTVSAPLAAAVGCGLVAGTLASIFLLKITEKLLYGVKPLDPWSLAGAGLLIAAGAALAAAGPAMRAMRIQPAIALREE